MPMMKWRIFYVKRSRIPIWPSNVLFDISLDFADFNMTLLWSAGSLAVARATDDHDIM